MESTSSINPSSTTSSLLPSFLRRLADPSIQSVAIAGCGGGFDFVHSLNLYPELLRLNKKVTIVSYSFGDVRAIKGPAAIYWEQSGVVVKEVTSKSIPDDHYNPEVSLVSFLDHKYPKSAPHKIYACNARQFTVPLLTDFYTTLVKYHHIDAFVVFDGGSDSLMVGDENGLGDPIEDCVTITAVSLLKDLKAKILISVGFGADRFNQVSDASSLRAVAEITKAGGFLGCVSLEPTSEGFQLYQEGVQWIYSRQTFRSVLTGLIIESGKGNFGYLSPSDPSSGTPSLGLDTRVSDKTAFVWPLMSFLFTFDVDVVVKRSLLSSWILDAPTVDECYRRLRDNRQKLKKAGKLRETEELPLQSIF